MQKQSILSKLAKIINISSLFGQARRENSQPKNSQPKNSQPKNRDMYGVYLSTLDTLRISHHSFSKMSAAIGRDEYETKGNELIDCSQFTAENMRLKLESNFKTFKPTDAKRIMQEIEDQVSIQIRATRVKKTKMTEGLITGEVTVEEANLENDRLTWLLSLKDKVTELKLDSTFLPSEKELSSSSIDEPVKPLRKMYNDYIDTRAWGYHYIFTLDSVGKLQNHKPLIDCSIFTAENIRQKLENVLAQPDKNDAKSVCMSIQDQLRVQIGLTDMKRNNLLVAQLNDTPTQGSLSQFDERLVWLQSLFNEVDNIKTELNAALSHHPAY